MSAAGLRRAVNRAFGRAGTELAHHTALDQAALDFVEDVLERQDDSVRMRYKRLHLSVDKGNGLKSRLVRDGILEEQEVKVGRTYKLLLRVTRHAIAELGLKKTLGRGSIAHEYWKRYYAVLLRESGYEVELEAPRRNGRVDLAAKKVGESIAIEVETGKSDAVSNVKQDLLSGFRSVVVVATDEGVFDRVEQQLGRAGLIIPSRTDIVLRDRWKQNSGAV